MRYVGVETRRKIERGAKTTAENANKGEMETKVKRRKRKKREKKKYMYTMCMYVVCVYVYVYVCVCVCSRTPVTEGDESVKSTTMRTNFSLNVPSALQRDRRYRLQRLSRHSDPKSRGNSSFHPTGRQRVHDVSFTTVRSAHMNHEHCCQYRFAHYEFRYFTTAIERKRSRSSTVRVPRVLHTFLSPSIFHPDSLVQNVKREKKKGRERREREREKEREKE